MRTVSREVIEYAMMNANLETEDLRDNYSGRGMYGQECFGFVTNDYGSPFAFFVQLGIIGAQNEEDTSIEDSDYFDTGAAEQLAMSAQTDSMGRGSIVYFPGWQVS
jgi:hypothetical protein